MVYLKPLLYCFRLVIITNDQLSSAQVADSVILRSIIFHMVGCPALRTHTSAAHASYDGFIRNLDVYGEVDCGSLRAECLRKSVSLIQCTREAIQDISACAVIFGKTVCDKIKGELIRNQQSLIDIRFRLIAQLCMILDV